MFWAMTRTQVQAPQDPARHCVIETPSIDTPSVDDEKTEPGTSGKADEQQYVIDDDDLLDRKVKLKMRRLLWYLVLIPFVFSVWLWLMGTYATKDYLPSSLDVHLWRNFSTHVKESVQAMDSKYPHNVLLVLLAMHTVQVLFCFPLLHVTKIMYGYFFHALQGGLIACLWELFIVGLFVVVATQNIPTRQPAMDLVGFLHYVDSMRSKRLLIPFLVAMHISSVPLITSTCRVLFQVVSRFEFFFSHFIATSLMTFKDTWLGDFLAFSDGNAGNIALAATLLSMSALLPTVVTVMLMGFVSAASVSKSSGYKSFTRL